MSKRWLVLDTNYLCWKNYHTGMRDLSHNDMDTGSIFGILKDVMYLQNLFATTNVAFCFDDFVSNRAEVYKGYKEDRQRRKEEMSLEDHRKYISMITQITVLRVDILPHIGFQNIFAQEGCEADDMIASICQHNPGVEIVIVSADHDLLQLLRPLISIYNPTQKKTTTQAAFEEKWGIAASDWPLVKSIAGCSSDSIPGVKGVGESYAAKFIKGELTKGKKYDAIIDSKTIIKRNLKLVRLPFPGTVPCVLQKDHINETRWNKLVKKYGMTSLQRSAPKFRD